MKTTTVAGHDVRLAFDDALRAAINLGRSQAYADANPERRAWVRADERHLEEAQLTFWRTLEKEE